MTVIHLISGLSSGGAEHFLLELCTASAKHRRVNMVVISLGSIHTIEFLYRNAGIEYYFLHINKWGDLPRGLRKIRALVRQLQRRNGGPLLIHSHMFHACMMAGVLRLFYPRMPQVFSLHNRHVEQTGRKILLWLCRPLRNVDILFPGTTRSWFQKRQLRVIGNGIPMDRYQLNTVADPPFTCLFLGRLEPQKDPLSLVNLAAQLRGKYVFRILVAGEGSLFRSLKEKIAQQGLQDYFELLGYTDEPVKLLARAHCLLLPSRWEGMPLALLEAAASGIPVIATPVGNIPSFADASNAFIGGTATFPRLLAAVMDDYPSALLKAEKLQQRVKERYDIAGIARQYEDLYLKYAGNDKPA